MKKKKQIVLLVPLVVIIWGVIGYRIYKTVKGNTEVKELVTIHNLPVQAVEKKEVYTLKLDYSDPFLKNRRSYSPPVQNTVKAESKPKPVVVKTVKKIPVRWPNIVYHGLIEHKKDHRILYLVEVDGVSHFMHEGQLQDELELVKAYQDSIWVKYKEEDRKTFKKAP